MGAVASSIPAIDPVLQSLFGEELYTAGEQSFHGFDLAPIIEIDGLSAQYPALTSPPRVDLSKGAYFSTLADGTPPRQVGVTVSSDSVSLGHYAYESNVSEALAAQAAAQGFDLEELNRQELAYTTRSNHEYAVMSALSTSGNYATTSDPGNLNTVTTALQSPLLTAVKTVTVALNGLRPTHIVVNADVAQAMLLNNDVKSSYMAAVPSGGARSQGVPMPYLYEWVKTNFNCELMVSSVQYVNASGTATYMMGNHIAVVRIAPGPAGFTFLRTFTDRRIGTGLGPANRPSLAAIQVDDTQRVRLYQRILVARQFFALKAANPTAGYLLTDVLS